jgi:hypothetical protein
MVMPTGAAIEDSGVLIQLSYYKLSVPVVPHPRSLNDQAMRVGSRFMQHAVYHHERFLAMAFVRSYETLDWLARNSIATDYVHELGVFDGVEVLEFVPRGASITSPPNQGSLRGPTRPSLY